MLSQSDIRETFDRAHESEYPALAKRVLQYNASIGFERRENARTHVKLFAAFDEIDWMFAAMFTSHERHDLERN